MGPSQCSRPPSSPARPRTHEDVGGFRCGPVVGDVGLAPAGQELCNLESGPALPDCGCRYDGGRVGDGEGGGGDGEGGGGDRLRQSACMKISALRLRGWSQAG